MQFRLGPFGCFRAGVDLMLRVIRGAVGVCILVILTASMVMPSVLPVTGNSVVNTDLIWVRTPIDGIVELQAGRIGGNVQAGETLAQVVNNRVDDSLLSQLLMQELAMDSRLESLEGRKVHIQNQKQLVGRRLSQSLRNLNDELHRESKKVSVLLAKAEVNGKLLQQKLKRYQEANRLYSSQTKYGVISRMEIETVQQEYHKVLTDINGFRDEFAFVGGKLDKLASDGHLGAVQSPELSELRMLNQSLGETDQEMELLKAQLEGVKKDIEKRESLLSRMRSSELVSSVNGILWDKKFSDGAVVRNGDEVIAVASTDALVIECIFSQRYLDNINIGDHATISLMGGGEKLAGRVKEILIRDKEGAGLGAFNIGSPSSDEFKVIVSLDRNHAYQPVIGQRAKVMISRSEDAALAKLVLFFNR